MYSQNKEISNNIEKTWHIKNERAYRKHFVNWDFFSKSQSVLNIHVVL